MKAYFVVKEPSERTINHFVSSLGMALETQGCEVVYGLERLWTDEVLTCDIIHFQWPEGIFGLFSHHVTEEELLRMDHRLTWLKEQGKKIFCTCHNLKPHTNKDQGVLQLYDMLYSYADTVVHLGHYSKENLQSQYKKTRHVVIPHHIYDNIFTFSASQQEARCQLHLPQDKKIVLSFGKFRNDEERQFVLELKNKCNHSSFFDRRTEDEILFLMPGFYRETLHTKNPKKLIRRLYHTMRYKLAGIRFSNEVIPDDLMQCYFRAADIVLIQRLDILNSGNLPMAFAAGKVVVGPNVGNVGEILRETNNYTFDPTNMESAALAVQTAFKDGNADKGNRNKLYAEQFWSSSVIAKALIDNYKMVMSEPCGMFATIDISRRK